MNDRLRAFRTPRAAFDAASVLVSRATRCVTAAHLDSRTRDVSAATPLFVALNRNQPTPLRAPTPLRLAVRQMHRAVRDEDGWRVRVVGYWCALLDERHPIVMYHWHPEQTPSVAFPHLHLEAGADVRRDELTRAHLPTGWVPLEAVLRLAITDFGAEPTREDWRDILTHTETAATATRGDAR